MKTPDFVSVGYWGMNIPFDTLKEGDEIELSFGKERTRLTTFIVKSISRNSSGKIYSMSFLKK